jgi:predicted nucleotidyltransferase
MASPPAELTTLLSRLAASGVEFVLVGGLAAVAQGAPLTTQDVDIVHRRTAENVENLLEFLATVNARYRGHSGAALLPSASALLGSGHNLLMTDLGPLDVLGTIEGGRGYDELLPAAISVAVVGHPVKVLGLDMLAALKRGSASNKDKLTLLILDETLRRRPDK